MNFRLGGPHVTRLEWIPAAAIAGFAALSAVSPARGDALAAAPEERIWIHRNLGTAYLDNESFEEAAAEFGAAVQLSAADPRDLRNAGIAALRAGDLSGARSALEAAIERAAGSAETAYALGILEKRAGNAEAAITRLRECRQFGGDGPEVDYNLGILAIRQKDLETAAAEFRSVIDRGADLAPRHFPSALYRYGRTQLQLKNREAGTDALKQYQALVKAGAGAELAEEDLEIGTLLDAAIFVRPPDVRAAGALPAFAVEALPVAGDLRWAEAADLDGDGDTDLVVGNGQTLHDLRRGPDGWTDVTASRGLAGLLGITGARALDVDNDGQIDLIRSGGSGLHFHPGVDGAWDPPVRLTGDPLTAFVPVDFDHEGDVDFAAVGAGGVQLLRNNGDRTFADVTEASGLAAVGPSVAVIAADFDDDQDVDFAFVTRRGEVRLASNLRGGRFDVLPALPAPSGAFALAAGDLDGDGQTDLAVAAPRGIFLLRNEGQQSFTAVSTDPVVPGALHWPTTGGVALWTSDLDNDGRLDLLGATERGAILGINAGDFRFLESAEPLRPVADAGARPVAVLLIDGDARLDLVTSRGESGFARNIGGTGNGFVVRLQGVKNNRDGVGTIVEVLVGSRYARRDGGGGPLHFGLGDAKRADAARIRWPNGIHQALLEPQAGAQSVEEKAGLVGSCPFLYTWNGERFEYLTDILTVTPLGLPVAPGMFVPPNWDEVIRVTDEQMRPDPAGFLVAQVTEELREVTYLDQVRLIAIDHPETVEVQPNEKFKFPPFPEFGVHVLDGALPPVRATDHRGRDVTEKLLFVDDSVVGDLPLTRYQGIGDMHSLVLDFGTVAADQPVTLHLAGWFYWTNASINIAISQDPRHDFIPPQLEVQRPDGSFEKWPIEVGFPGGKTKSIPVDLTGAFPNGRAVVRLSTTLRIYWDRALLQVGTSAVTPRLTELLPDEANLHFRGHSEPILSVTGEEPERFEYDQFRSEEVPWDQHPGLYTRYGDVTPLVQEPEDHYVIMASGDECTVRWRADRLPELAAGLRRTYFLVFDGWAKDGDPNTTLSGEVEPLPFHAMSGYPYGPDEAYPDSPEHQAYRAEWNTREAVRLIRDLAASKRLP
jgi:Flp pilus assembly protein TadD